MSIRDKILTGVVKSMKMKRTVVVQRDYLPYTLRSTTSLNNAIKIYQHIYRRASGELSKSSCVCVCVCVCALRVRACVHVCMSACVHVT